LEEGRALSDIEGLSYKENGKLVVKPPREPGRDLDAIPPAAYDLLQMESYLKIPLDIPMSNPGATLSVTRGCYGNCNYVSPFPGNCSAGASADARPHGWWTRSMAA